MNSRELDGSPSTLNFGRAAVSRTLAERELTAEIAEARRVMEVQVATQQDLLRATVTEKAKIRVALDFFEPKGHRSPGLGARD